MVVIQMNKSMYANMQKRIFRYDKTENVQIFEGVYTEDPNYSVWPQENWDKGVDATGQDISTQFKEDRVLLKAS